MQLQPTIRSVFVQLSESLHLLSEEQYTQPSKILFNATIGQHVRHIIELFSCLEEGYKTGIVNYDKRKRDIAIEKDKNLASLLLQKIYSSLDRPDKKLLLEASYDEDSSELVSVITNYYREIIYNLEHTVHHMALIRVGFTEVSSIRLPEGFGVASSTVKYRKECAQ